MSVEPTVAHRAPRQKRLTRRAFVQAAGAMAGAVALPGVSLADTKEVTLRPAAGRTSLIGAAGPHTDIWSYNDTVPGPAIRLRAGERLRAAVHNDLTVPTTVHWHGIRLPNGMDGVPNLTQAPIEPGASFIYEFRPPDAGTYWYHSHFRAFEQVERGLAGPLIVDEPVPIEVDRDVTWLIDDWRLAQDGSLAGGFGARHDMSHAGRLGNTVTVNGREMFEFPVKTGERLRLRLINAANARVFALVFEQHAPWVIALDGQPVAPHRPANDRVVLGPGMRADLILDCNAPTGSRTRVIDRFYRRRAYEFLNLVYTDSLRTPDPKRPVPELARSHSLPEPDLVRAQKHTITLSGGAMGGMRGAVLDGRWQAMRALVKEGIMWTLGDIARRPNEHGLAIIEASLNSSHIVSLKNETAFPHPMHLHGHHFRVLSRNGSPEPHKPWRDTVLVLPRETVDVAFNADNAGNWLFHCHVLEHHASGMGAVVRVG